MNQKIYEHDTEISPAIRYCQPCMYINLQKFVKMEKYFGQQCQDDEVNKKFRELHHKLVNEVISFCKENNVSIDEFHLNADCVEPSIPYGQWEACTDSCLEFYTSESNEKGTPYLISI